MTYFIEDRAIELIKYDFVFIPPNTYYNGTYYENTNQERTAVSSTKENLTGIVFAQRRKRNHKSFFGNLIRYDAIEIKKEWKQK